MEKNICERCRWHYSRRYLTVKGDERTENYCGEKHSLREGEATLDCDDYWKEGNDLMREG